MKANILEIKNIIVGNGLAALSMALMFDKLNIDYKLVTNCLENEVLKNQSLQTIALSSKSIEIMSEFGVILSNLSNIGEIHIFADEECVILQNQENIVGYVIRYSDLIQNLLQKINKNNIIQQKVSDNYFLNGDNYLTLEDGQLLVAKNVFLTTKINCGEWQFLYDKVSLKYNQRALVFDVNINQDHHNYATESFIGNAGILATLPLQNQSHLSVIWTMPKDSARHYEYNHNSLLSVFKKYYNISPDIQIISQIQGYDLSVSCNKYLKKDGVFLLGSALYSIHPVAGQGFNLLLRDIFQLVENISKDSKIDHKIIINRISDILRVTIFTDLLIRLYRSNFLIPRLIRKGIFSLIKNNQKVQNLVIKALSRGKLF